LSNIDQDILLQSGVIAYKRNKGVLKILLVTNTGKSEWIVPKGKLEPDMTPQQSALQEALEEGGVKGVISGEVLGAYTFEKRKSGRLCRVELFPMQVDKEIKNWTEKSKRERRWCTVPEALELVANPELRHLISDMRI